MPVRPRQVIATGSYDASWHRCLYRDDSTQLAIDTQRTAAALLHPGSAGGNCHQRALTMAPGRTGVGDQAALAFATWLEMASIKGGDRQS